MVMGMRIIKNYTELGRIRGRQAKKVGGECNYYDDIKTCKLMKNHLIRVYFL